MPKRIAFSMWFGESFGLLLYYIYVWIFPMTNRIMEREKQLSILYQKQGRATQFSSKASRDKWLQKEIDDLERVRSSNMVQVTILNDLL